MNKRGFTMVELMVYLAIVGIVVIIAGRAFSNSTSMRMESESMIKANQESENLGVLLRDDFAQMGAKTVLDSVGINGSHGKMKIVSAVYMDTAGIYKDSSSFKYFPGKKTPTNNPGSGQSGLDIKRDELKDSIVMRRVKLEKDGSLSRVEEVSWYVTKNGTLKRLCNTVLGIDDSLQCPRMVDVAMGVGKFSITPATPGHKGDAVTLFPLPSDSGRFRLIPRSDPTFNVVSINVSPSNIGAKSFGMSGFTSNFSESGPSADVVYHQVFVGNAGEVTPNWKQCHKFSFSKDTTYEISFKTPYSEDDTRMFRPGIDHLSLGLRKVVDNDVQPCGAVEDLFVFPPQTDKAPENHVLRFTPGDNYRNACIVFTMAFFSPTVESGTIYFSDLNLKVVAGENYKFIPGYNPDSSNIAEKVNVRAFKIDVGVVRNGAQGVASVVVPVPSNGVAE